MIGLNWYNLIVCIRIRSAMSTSEFRSDLGFSFFPLFFSFIFSLFVADWFGFV